MYLRERKLRERVAKVVNMIMNQIMNLYQMNIYRSSYKLTVILLLLLAVVISSSCGNSAPPPADAMRAAANNKDLKSIDPQVFTVMINRLDGAKFRLSDFKGKVVMVDFWATYCAPCVKMMPMLSQLSKKYKDQGLEIVGLTSDDESDKVKVENFLKKAGVEYNIGYANSWISDAFLKSTEDDSGAPPIPQLFVISRDGQFVEHFVGDSPDRNMQFFETLITRELKK